MVQEKNADELFQNFVWHTQSVDTDSLKDAAASEIGEGVVNKEKVKEDGNQGTSSLPLLVRRLWRMSLTYVLVVQPSATSARSSP
jgi:hypothetical protein